MPAAIIANDMQPDIRRTDHGIGTNESLEQFKHHFIFACPAELSFRQRFFSLPLLQAHGFPLGLQLLAVDGAHGAFATANWFMNHFLDVA